MVFKFIILAAVLYIVYIKFFKSTKQNNEDETDTLVECPKCGTFVSKSDAILSNGQYYCSKECLK